MFFIRATSCPEYLCVYEDTSGAVVIHHGVMPPLADRRSGLIDVPARTFYALCRRWAAGAEPVTVRGLCVREVYVYLRSGKPVLFRSQVSPRSPCEFMIRLSYRRRFVHMWRVTWAYIVANACRAIDKDATSAAGSARPVERRPT